MHYIEERFQTMPWDAFDSVVFDIGNVLIRFSPQHTLDVLIGEDAALKAELMERIFRSPHWLDLDRGTVTYEQAAQRMSQGNPAIRPEVDRVLGGWMSVKTPIREGVDALRRCKEMGKRLYVLSNYHEPAYEWLLERYDFFSLFDGGVISCYVHLLKPEPEIYRELIARCALEPARTLFLDDTPANVQGAMQAGIAGFLAESPQKVARFFGV